MKLLIRPVRSSSSLSWRIATSCVPRVGPRSLHSTGAVQKIKKGSNINEGIDDAFAIEEDGDLFAISEDAPPAKNDGSSRSQASKIASHHAEYFRRAKNELLANPQYAAYYRWREQNTRKTSDSPITDNTVVQKHAKAKDPPRRAILAKMIAHASTRAELLEIVDVFSIYREQKWRVDELNRIDFIGRCINLKSPDIALAVLYYRPRFAIDLPSLSTGRALLHSLLWTPYPPTNTPLPDHLALPTTTPFTHAMLLANLFNVYALPPVESDQVARALLLGACASSDGKDIDTSNVVTITQKIREWVESQRSGDSQRLVRSVKAIKERGKTATAIKAVPVVSAANIPLEQAPFYGDELTVPERSWIQGGLDSFIRWAQGRGEDTTWVEKLKLQVV